MLPHGHAERSCGELLCGAGGASEVGVWREREREREGARQRERERAA